MPSATASPADGVVSEGDRQPFTILLVCTGNICRSALAERLGRAYLRQELGAEADAIRLVSAGTRAVVDSAMHPDSALVLRGYGAEPGDFRARQLTEAHVTGADLTLAMTRGHRRDVLGLNPRALTRTFTLREAAELLELLDEDVEIRGDSVRERALRLVQAMADARPRREAHRDADDVLDPIGRSIEVHEQAGELIVASLLPVLARFAALAAPGTSPAAPDTQR